MPLPIRTLACILAGSSITLSLSAIAQQIDNTGALPDAKPGECYAKVVIPAEFSTTSEEVIVQAASERIETFPAEFESVEQTIVVKEGSQTLSVTPAKFEDVVDKVEVSPAELVWTRKLSSQLIPASPGALEGIAASGVDLDAVEAGSCYREYFTEAQYETEIQQVITRPASQEITITPAEYETVEQRVMVKEASTQVVDLPAVFRSETESVLVEPARGVWKSEGCGPIQKIDNATGEVLCFVEVPARYETITKTVLETAATTRTIDIPAIFKTVKVQRLVRPASEQRVDIPAEYTNVETRVKVSDAKFFWVAKGVPVDDNAKYTGREICLTERPAEHTSVKKSVIAAPASVTSTEVPPQYQSIEVQKLLSPASEKRTLIPATTTTVSSKVQSSPERLEWRRVLCEINMTPRVISSLQRALVREGYDPGPVDGVVGRGTLVAVKQYQEDKNLDQGGLTHETLKSLKVNH